MTTSGLWEWNRLPSLRSFFRVLAPFFLFVAVGLSKSTEAPAKMADMTRRISKVKPMSIPETFRMSSIRIVFSDVDGTLVHYPDESDSLDDSSNDPRVLHLPKSSSGLRGVISKETLRLCRKLRQVYPSTQTIEVVSEDGVESSMKLVLVSGMRTTTLLQRIPYLPLADAYCSENGGRIFYPDLVNVDGEENVAVASGNIEAGTNQSDDDPFCFTPLWPDSADRNKKNTYHLREDMTWRRIMSSADAAGEDGYSAILSESATVDKPIAKRRGKLWDFARQLMNLGYILDDRGYATCFRVNFGKQKQQTLAGADIEQFHHNIKALVPEGLVASTNLGCMDVYPKASGKKNCCKYIMAKFNGGSLHENGIFLCDDDNDLELALSCRLAFVPSITSTTMERAIEANPSKVVVAATATSGDADKDKSSPIVKMGTTDATDIILNTILGLCQTS